MSSLFADRARQGLVARFARNGTADHPAWRLAVAFPEPWPSLGGQFKAEVIKDRLTVSEMKIETGHALPYRFTGGSAVASLCRR